MANIEKIIVPGYGENPIYDVGAERASNKVTTISGLSTDAQYPSAKCVYDNLSEKSSVTVSASGTATDEVEYITIDGVEKKIAGGGTGDFDDLTNRPSYNGTPMTHSTNIPEVKTAAWDGKQDAISDLSTIRTGAEKGATAVQPSAIADMATKTWVNAQGFITSLAGYATQAWVQAQGYITSLAGYATEAWVTARGYYSKPTGGIPSGDMTAAVQASLGKADSAVQADDISDMATQTWVEGKGYITAGDIPVLSVNGKTGTVTLTAADLGLSTVFNLKGSKPTYTALPSTGNVIGDVWYVVDESVGYIWLNDGTTNRWEQLGLSVDLSNYVTTEALATALSGYVAKVAGKGLSTNDFTDAYKTKLDSAITSLAGYATEAWVEGKGYLTQHQSLSAYRTSSAQDTIDAQKQSKITASGLLKGNGSGSVSAAVAGTDYQAPVNFMTDPNEAVYKIDGKYISAMYDSNGDLLAMDSKLDKTGNGSNVTAAFTQATTRANIATGEKLSVLFGKIAKFFADLKTVAFTGSYNDLSNKPTIPTVPTNVSAFTNDAGYLTSHQSLAAYRTSAAQDEIDDDQDTAINNKENKGKITISGVEKTANTHTVTIVTNGVTSNFTLVGVS